MFDSFMARKIDELSKHIDTKDKEKLASKFIFSYHTSFSVGSVERAACSFITPVSSPE